MIELWRRRRHQDSQQACNAPTHHIAMQDTSLQWHWTLGLVPHLMDLTAGGLIYQSQIAGKCTYSAADTTKLNETASNALKNVETGGTAPKAQGKVNTVSAVPPVWPFPPHLPVLVVPPPPKSASILVPPCSQHSRSPGGERLKW
eukprot:gene24351-biopygen14944